jgi:hypothetical protein
MDLDLQQKMIEYKINELTILINEFKIESRKHKRKLYNKNYYNNKTKNKIFL